MRLATPRGVFPLKSTAWPYPERTSVPMASTSSTRSRSAVTSSWCPNRTARCRGVAPYAFGTIQSDGFLGIPAMAAISVSRDFAKLDFSKEARMWRALDPLRLHDVGSAPADTSAL